MNTGRASYARLMFMDSEARAFAAPRNDNAPVYHNPSIALAMMFFWISLVPP